MAGIVEGKSLEESVDMGHWLASLSIRELGPSYVLALPFQQQAKNLCQTPQNSLCTLCNPCLSVSLFQQTWQHTSLPSAPRILPDQQLTSLATRYPYPKQTFQASKA